MNWLTTRVMRKISVPPSEERCTKCNLKANLNRLRLLVFEGTNRSTRAANSILHKTIFVPSPEIFASICSSTPTNASVEGSLATEPVPQSAPTCPVETTVVQLRQLGQVHLSLTVSGHKFSSNTVTMIMCILLRVHGKLILYS